MSHSNSALHFRYLARDTICARALPVAPVASCVVLSVPLLGCIGIGLLVRRLFGLVVSDGCLDGVLGEPGRCGRVRASVMALLHGVVQPPAVVARTWSSVASLEGDSGTVR